MAERDYSPVAVVGMHGRFPNGADLSRFFESQLEGRDAIKTIPAERWDWRSIAGEPGENEDRSYSNCGGFISHADCFDARFFGILPREAESMDPQQRLFLQTAWSALEDAGHAPSALAGSKVGVFVGVGNADYPVLMRRDGVPIDAHRATGMALTSIANRVSFLLDLHGPSEAIDTACSSSLIAIHRAINAIHNGECEMAIAGGVNLLLGPELYIAFSKAGMLSRKGRCRTFDADCDGYVRGEGVGAILLCPLEIAARRGDHIYGVIRGSAENHGGRAHSFVAPNAPAQAEVIRSAWQRAGLSVGRASFIETHGTGTPLGDPIEINGLKTAIAGEPSAPDQKPIYLRALKSHVGHLEAAAGIAALISALMALNRGVVPGNLNHAKVNPHIDLDGTPFVISVVPVKLNQTDEAVPHLAGVSSFGFGGVNAHIVLQAHRAAPKQQRNSAQPRLIVLSAKNPAALRARAGQLLATVSEPVQVPGYERAMRALCGALGQPAEAHAETIKLMSLRLTPNALDKALARVGADLGAIVRFKDVRDCVTLGEVAERISACPSNQPAIISDEPPILACGVAVPSKRMAAASLDEIAFTLLEGRDHMRERLAIIAASKEELFARLSKFLDPKNTLTDRWLTGAPRSNEAPHPEDGSEGEGLLAWARWFVGARDARPRWQDLYDEPPPDRVPLPAYPFELTRIWYQKPVHAPLKVAAPSSALIVGDPSAESLVTLWHAAWEPSRERPSDGIIALARLSEHAFKACGGAVALNDLRFGPPAALSMAVPLSVRRNGSTLQCLQDSPAPHVLAEARLIGMVPANSCTLETLPGLPIDTAEFRQSLSRSGIALSASIEIPSGIEASADALLLPLDLVSDTDSPDTFWVRTLALATAGWQHLAGANGSAILHPYRIASLSYEPRHVRQASRLLVAQRGTGPVRIVCHDGRGAVALAIEGLQLRAATAVRTKVAP
ncbi:MAG: polyketide synthase [Pseudomonadota bacterium]